MKTTIFGGLAVILGLLAATVPVFAHHSFAAEFDGNKQVTLTGVVTKVDWVNPHAYIYVDVKGDDGAVVNWAIETGAPNVLYRQGWRKADLNDRGHRHPGCLPCKGRIAHRRRAEREAAGRTKGLRRHPQQHPGTQVRKWDWREFWG